MKGAVIARRRGLHGNTDERRFRAPHHSAECDCPQWRCARAGGTMPSRCPACQNHRWNKL